MKKNIQNSSWQGFTLIEVLVVVAIIGVLTAVLLVNLVGIRERGADTRKKSDLNQVRSALRLFYNDAQAYPAATSCGSSTCFVACNGAACNLGSEMNSGSGGTVYMKQVPEYIQYWVSPDREQFRLGVVLDNAADPDISASAARCGVTPVEGSTVFYVCAE